MANNIGKITQIIGAVLDIKFTEGNLPEINDAIKVPSLSGTLIASLICQRSMMLSKFRSKMEKANW